MRKRGITMMTVIPLTTSHERKVGKGKVRLMPLRGVQVMEAQMRIPQLMRTWRTMKRNSISKSLQLRVRGPRRVLRSRT